MSTWWRVNTYAYEIIPVEVVSETRCFITIRHPQTQYQNAYERRTAVKGEYFPTFAEARTFLLGRLNSKFLALDQALKRTRAYTDKVFMMEEPG